MWFTFPKDVETISVEQQQFRPEHEENGLKFFRAPDHFAAKIMAIAGFKAQAPEACGLPDLPQPDPLRDGSIKEQAQEIAHLRGELEAAQAAVRAAKAEAAALHKQNEQLAAELAELKEELDDAGLRHVETPMTRGVTLGNKKA